MFSVALVNIFSGMSMTWFKGGGVLMDDATFSDVNTNTLTITSAANENEGNYNVAVIRTMGTICFINSDLAMLTVCK